MLARSCGARGPVDVEQLGRRRRPRACRPASPPCPGAGSPRVNHTTRPGASRTARTTTGSSRFATSTPSRRLVREDVALVGDVRVERAVPVEVVVGEVEEHRDLGRERRASPCAAGTTTPRSRGRRPARRARSSTTRPMLPTAGARRPDALEHRADERRHRRLPVGPRDRDHRDRRPPRPRGRGRRAPGPGRGGGAHHRVVRDARRGSAPRGRRAATSASQSGAPSITVAPRAVAAARRSS